jgi:hypothetical protein
MANELDRDALLELSVGALAEKDLAHATFADRAHDTEGTDALGRRCAFVALEQKWREAKGGRIEYAGRAVVRAEELEHLGAQEGVVAAGLIDERGLIGGRNVEHRVEHEIGAAEAIAR